MKIIHVTPTYYSKASVIGGGEKYVIYIIRALEEAAKKLDHFIEHLLLSFGETPDEFFLHQNIICRVLSGKPWDPYSICLPELQRQLSSAHIVVVHQCFSTVGLFVASHAKLQGKIVIGIDSGGGDHPLVSHTPESVLMYDFFLAHSRFAVGSFLGRKVPILNILGPIDTYFYKPNNPTQRDAQLIVALGRIMPYKGFDRIIKALPVNLKLIIAGVAYDKSYLQYLKDLSEKSQVTIEEGISDVEICNLLHKASLFIHASTHFDCRGNYHPKPELLGLAPLEALSCGTPTLVSAAGSLGELGDIPGCLVFSSDQELQNLLYLHSQSALVFPDAAIIHGAVVAKYGAMQFGEKLLTELIRFKAYENLNH